MAARAASNHKGAIMRMKTTAERLSIYARNHITGARWVDYFNGPSGTRYVLTIADSGGDRQVELGSSGFVARAALGVIASDQALA